MKLLAAAATIASLSAWAQEPLVSVSKIAAGFTFTEGAAWSKDGFLIFSDTPSNRLLKWTPGRMAEVYRENANGPAGNAFDSQGRLYTCESRARRITRMEHNGGVETVADRFEGKRFNAPTGIAVSKSGQIYFTDPAFGYQSDQRELDFYGVFRLASKSTSQLAAKVRGRPRGIAFSPNGRTLYVSDADAHTVRAYDLEHGGEASGERVLISGIAGVPGGISVDEKGNLYVAAKGMAIYTPEGRLVRTISLPDPASSCAFGEADMKSLFVTARGTVYRIRFDEK